MTDGEKEAVANRRQAAQQTDVLGPGTAGYTNAGAAYRSMEMAEDMGVPSPEQRGFSDTRFGLHPGQGMATFSTTNERAEDLSDQTINEAAQGFEHTGSAKMLVDPKQGE